MEDIKYIKDLESLKVISDSIRVEILLNFKNKVKNAQDIAQETNINRSKVHYHLNELEDKGFIEVVRTEIKNGIIQKFYAPVAKAFIPDLGLFNDEFFSTFKEVIIEKEKLTSFKKEVKEVIERYHVDEETPNTQKVSVYLG